MVLLNKYWRGSLDVKQSKQWGWIPESEKNEYAVDNGKQLDWHDPRACPGQARRQFTQLTPHRATEARDHDMTQTVARAF